MTTHKLDLYAAARDRFDVIDPHATLMGETSCLSKRDGALVCHAKDPISSGLAIDAFIPAGYWARTPGRGRLPRRRWLGDRHQLVRHAAGTGR